MALRWVVGVSVVAAFGSWACSGTPEKVEQPAAEPASAGTDLELHEALVALHKTAIGECFGGFGKGAPYAMKFTVSGGTVATAESTPLSDKHGEFPASCVEKTFVGASLPTTESSLKARFAVDNPDCDLPTCPDKDLPCTFKRDIACTVIID